MDATMTQISSTRVSTYTSYSQRTVSKQTTTGNEPGAAAVVELGDGTAKASAGIYGPTVEAMKKEAEARYENLRTMVRELIARQYGFSTDETAVEMPPEIREQAQIDIAAGGYYSAESVATRILDFAKALSGGDASKFKMLRDAVEKGFADATDALGGELPEISRQTYDLVQKGFDQWAEELGIAEGAQG